MSEPSELFPKPSSPSTADQHAPAAFEASAPTADERAAESPGVQAVVQAPTVASAEGHPDADYGSSVEAALPSAPDPLVIMPPPLVSAEPQAKGEVITIVLPDPNSESAKSSLDKALADDAVSKSAPKPAATHIVCSVCGTRNRVGVLICEECGNVLVNGEHGIGTKQFENTELQSGKLSATVDVSADAKAIPGTAELNAAKLSTSSAQAVEYNTMIAGASTMGSDKFEKNMVLRLEIEAATAPILVYPRGETHIGRRDPSTGIAPDVDLTAYAGYRMGVSRNHVVIKMKEQQLEVYDQGSSNGSMLNGSRLEPYKPQTLRNGDELVLGKMSLRVTFQTRS